ncbi:MAG: 4Fe-4S cluster-binding domain-containing protein, partial [Candidatus Methanomethylophilaceae archaeon]|nr:4Fe-4S cluster-binding domain-containing protein [Candidatus Methanomethylophilaceae archaeon]
KGCWNTQYQSNKPASLIPASELLETILDQGNDVTFLGGEPLQQIGNLSWLVDKLNQYGVHIMLYTGYELEEIEADPPKRELCQKVDILIPGRYRDELRDTNLLWRGSQNQPLIYLHNPQQTKDENQVEITIEPDGSVTCLGYPSEELIKHINSLDHISL